MKAPLPSMSVALLAAAMSLAQCGGGDDDGPPPAPPQCVENMNVDCTEVFYPPLYSNIFREVIQKQCTLGSNCHSSDAAMGGLVLASPDDAYDTLLGLKGGTKRVVPFDAKCSPLMVRLESRDPNYVMPQGSRLLEEELCDFVQWIQRGAEKN